MSGPPNNAPPKDTPRLSVLIPTYNRWPDLLRTLRAYERQEPADLRFEVVVVDDGSSDGTAEQMADFRSERYPIHFSSQGNAGPALARNRAFERASGEWILFTGDDIEPAPDLLHQHLEGHGRLADPRCAVLGLTRWPADARLTATMRHIDGPGAQQFSYAFFEDGAEYDFRHFYTSNVSIRRQMLAREPGPFSTAFPAAAFEDAEIGHRLAFHGLRIVYRRSAVAFHHHPYGARGFYRRQERCGRMAALLFERNPELEKWLGPSRLEWRRLELLRLSGPERRRLAFLADHYEPWRDHALALAERCDPSDPPGIDDLLRPLFHLGYLEGLAHALLPEASARRLLMAELVDRVAPAALALAHRAGPALGPFADVRRFGQLRAFG